MNIDDAIEKLRSAGLVADIVLADSKRFIRGGTKSTEWLGGHVYDNAFAIAPSNEVWKGHVQGPGSISIRFSSSTFEGALDTVLGSYMEITHFDDDSLTVEQAVEMLTQIGLQSEFREKGNLIEGHPSSETANPALSRFVIFKQGNFYLVTVQLVDNRVAVIKFTGSLHEALVALRTFWKDGTISEMYLV